MDSRHGVRPVRRAGGEEVNLHRPAGPGVKDAMHRPTEVRQARGGHAAEGPAMEGVVEDDDMVPHAFGAAGQFDEAFVSVNAVDTVFDDAHTMAPGQVVIGRGEVGHGFAAANHQVGDGARDKSGAGFDQGHIDAVVRPHAHIFSSGGTPIAATHHHHLGASATWGGAT
jgi:hypothetical protein